MEKEALQNLYDQLAALATSGDEMRAQELLSKHFNELPEELQGEIVTRLYLNAVQDQAAEANALMDVQERGIATIEVLEALQKELERGSVEPSQSS